MSPLLIGICGIIVFFVLIFLNMPIAFAMAIVGLIGFALLTTPSAALAMLSTDLFSTFSSYTLSVIPMFVLMGFLAFYSKIGARLYNWDSAGYFIDAVLHGDHLHYCFP